MTTAVLYHHPDDTVDELRPAVAALDEAVSSLNPYVRADKRIPRGRLFVVLSDAA